MPTSCSKPRPDPLRRITKLWRGRRLARFGASAWHVAAVLVAAVALPVSSAAFVSLATNSGNSLATQSCWDADSDGICNTFEDRNTDADNNPATNPGPDTDGDGTADYLDGNDDGDLLITSIEGADPNADGNPRDARDRDRDGQPDYLDPTTSTTGMTVATNQKISDTVGGLATLLDNGDAFGAAVATIGDVDSDGIADLAVGADADDDGGPNRGAVFVLLMNPNGTVRAEQKISDTTGGLVATLDNGDNFGRSIAGIGDLDGDRVPEIVVGALNDDDGGADRGAVYVLYLTSSGTVKAEQKISDLAGGFASTLDDTDQFGTSVADLGDVDGDGVPDIAVGSPKDDDGGIDRGAVYVLFMNLNGTVKGEQKISSTTGSFGGTLDDSDVFGYAVAGIGDFDGDGRLDLMVGAAFDDDGGPNHGAVYIVTLLANGTANATMKISDTVGGLVSPLDPSDQFGSSITGIGDLDGNGVPDVVVGSPFDDDGGTDRGSTYVLRLTSSGTVLAEQKINSTTGGLGAAIDDDDRIGWAVAGMGDLDGDGRLGFVTSARNDDDGGTDRGALYVIDLVAG